MKRKLSTSITKHDSILLLAFSSNYRCASVQLHRVLNMAVDAYPCLCILLLTQMTTIVMCTWLMPSPLILCSFNCFLTTCSHWISGKILKTTIESNF